MRLAALCLIGALILAACSPAATRTLPPTPTQTAAPATAAASAAALGAQSASDSGSGSPDEADVLRKLAFDYWEAFNAYDVDRVLGFLEPAYRQEREKQIRSDIGQVKFWHVKLGLSEESAPQPLSADKAEMYMTLKEPTGTRRIRMEFVRRDAGWLLTYSQEVQ